MERTAMAASSSVWLPSTRYLFRTKPYLHLLRRSLCGDRTLPFVEQRQHSSERWGCSRARASPEMEGLNRFPVHRTRRLSMEVAVAATSADFESQVMARVLRTGSEGNDKEFVDCHSDVEELNMARNGNGGSDFCRESDKDMNDEMPAQSTRTLKDLEQQDSVESKKTEEPLEPLFKGIVVPEAAKPYILTRHKKLPTAWGAPTGTAVLIDKPKGWTSFTVCGKLRSLLGVKKVGHAGTLDPMATGLLIVCVGNATKMVDSFQAMTKVYTGTMRLGEATPSGDIETPVNMTKEWEHITDENIEKARSAFIGEIRQIPPIYSAIKVNGERLYEKARRGEKVVIPARKIYMYKFEVSRIPESRQDLKFRVECSKGTYVRSLCVDLGKALGSCAVMTSLRRESNGMGFSRDLRHIVLYHHGDLLVSDAWTYQELEEKVKAVKSFSFGA